MIAVNQFVSTLTSAGVDFFCGVPDSLLKNFCAYVTDLGQRSKVKGQTEESHHCLTSDLSPLTSVTHVITANEGGAIGLAAGHYLATGRPALVYMQNSGQGNAVNPLASLADPDVYSIPMILLVGWRGMPGVHDEPQHVKQGKVTISLFETLGIPTYVIPDDDSHGEHVEHGDDAGRAVSMKPPQSWQTVVSNAIAEAISGSRPVALIVKKGLFGDYKLQNKKPDIAALPREQAIEGILAALPPDAVIVSTTGMISRELYELRERLGQRSMVKGQTEESHHCLTSDLSPLTSPHSHDFLTVGSMGHASQIALGIAMAQPNRTVVCLDGDGASIMQMGNMAILGQSKCHNLIHIVLNNSAHDSVGGQPTVGGAIDLPAIAAACGYEVVEGLEKVGGESRSTAESSKSEKIPLSTSTSSLLSKPKPRFLEIRVAKGARPDLGRPKEPPQVNKALFMQTLSQKV